MRGVFLLIGALCLSIAGYTQFKRPVEDATRYRLSRYNNLGQKYVVGKEVDSDAEHRYVRDYKGDTLKISKNYIIRKDDSDNLLFYRNGRYNLKTGWTQFYSLGAGDHHINFSNGVAYRDKFYEIGGGWSFNYNAIPIYTPTDQVDLEVLTFGLFAQGKLFITKTSWRWYIRSLVGYGNHIKTETTNYIKDGPLFENGLGWEFATKMRMVYSFEVFQYNTWSRGSLNFPQQNRIDVIEFENWFNRVVVRFGLNIPLGGFH